MFSSAPTAALDFFPEAVLQARQGLLTYANTLARHYLPQLEEGIHSYEHELIVKATAKVVGEILEARGQ